MGSTGGEQLVRATCGAVTAATQQQMHLYKVLQALSWLHQAAPGAHRAGSRHLRAARRSCCCSSTMQCCRPSSALLLQPLAAAAATFKVPSDSWGSW